MLELNDSNPTPEEIQSQCRKLARKWHPDKYKKEEEKVTAQEKFIEVQKACDILDKIRQRRTEKSMKPEEQDEATSRSEKHEYKFKDRRTDL